MAMAMAVTSVFLLLLLLVLQHDEVVLVVSDPSDESCLSSLYASLSRSPSLHNWTAPNFANPCNGFTSLISGATCNNGRIFKLSLPNLSLSGSLPSSGALANCTNLQSLDLSSNLLHGPIPVSISALLNLAVLNLSSNLLSGQIPPQLALCAYLNVIDLHSNRLTGPIPDQLGLLVRLSAFDVSFNQLEGPVPVTLANRTNGGGPRFNASSFLGNRDLYGFPLPPMRRQGLSVMAIVGIGLGSGLMSLVISFTAVCIWLRVTERSAIVNGELMQHHQGLAVGVGGGGGGGGQGKISNLNMPDY